MRRKSSRQLSPQSTNIRVCPPETTALLPFDPDASTVKRIMVREYREGLCIGPEHDGTARNPLSSCRKSLSIPRRVSRKQLTLLPWGRIIVATKIMNTCGVVEFFASQEIGFARREESLASVGLCALCRSRISGGTFVSDGRLGGLCFDSCRLPPLSRIPRSHDRAQGGLLSARWSNDPDSLSLFRDNCLPGNRRPPYPLLRVYWALCSRSCPL